MERLPMVQERLLIARRRAGLSQGDLAQEAGVHISDISKYERGRSVPTLARLARLCRALGVSADYLLGLAAATDATGVPPDHTHQDAAVASAST